MQVVSILYKVPEDAGADLLSLVLSRSWNRFACRVTCESGSSEFLKPEMTAIPREMGLNDPSGQVQHFEASVDFNGKDSAVARGALAVVNSRYALEVDREILLGIAGEAAGVTLVDFTAGPSYYDEMLRISDNGQVLGYRRSYHARTFPAALPDSWPKLMLIGSPIRRLFAGLPVPPDFNDFIALCRRRDVPVHCRKVSGLALDLATPAGLLEYFVRILHLLPRSLRSNGGHRQPPGVSLYGDIMVEEGSRIGKGVVAVGPLYLAQGCEIGANVFLSGCIIGPGAVVPADAVLRRHVWLGSGKAGAVGGLATAPVVRLVGRTGYRRWPLFSYSRLGKRIFDFLFALCAMALLAIVFPAIAVAIKCTSRGPVFYKHRRQGLRSRGFNCLKFRTMITNASEIQQDLMSINEVDGPQFKIEDDPRVTTVGHFLRATNLDELPQFLNVLAGQMSIVGPRPSPDEENQMCPSWREARLSVRPGITGLWQVSRSPDRRNDFQEWIKYDKEYVRRISFALDVKIVLKTVALVSRRFLALFHGAREGAD